jgi:hypothetical protein
LSELLLLAKQARIELATSRFSPGRSPEVKRTFTTPEFLAAGISGPGVLPLLCQLSYSSLRRWRDLNPQPLVRCNPCLHHAANFSNLFPCLLISSLPSSGHTSSMYPRRPLRCVEFHAEKFREERMLTVFGNRTRSLSALSRRSSRELHHPGNSSPAVDCFGSKRLRRFSLESREQAVHETRSPWYHSVLAFVFVSQICLFTLSEDPGYAGTYD